MGCHFICSKAEAGGSEFKASLSNLVQLYFKHSQSKGKGEGLEIQLTDETLVNLSLNPSIMFQNSACVLCMCTRKGERGCYI